jgi:hypothetical protein
MQAGASLIQKLADWTVIGSGLQQFHANLAQLEERDAHLLADHLLGAAALEP